MLILKNIKKDYCTGDLTVHALKGVDISFRKNEFVSILGPSGCGKTTMLNIIGGLDQYTSGDLIINGKSTKDFRDRDWDAYRNHSIGFVFQSYNLIPHQSVLANVELALSLSGVAKAERRRRAKEALEAVGLGNQLGKKPSEMSGGQMQRVAIARALVNNPDIILADEPTGALDTETSKQVMDILKEVAKDRLVVMVTHNPDIAEAYSTRIIRMLDGVITDDSAPLTDQETAAEVKRDAERTEEEKKAKKQKKPSMSFFTSFGLSLKNLLTKKGRTILTSFAGSIGIIGIALIFAVSQGMTDYINYIQEETLSSYPLTLESQHLDMGTLLETFMGSAASSGEHENDKVYQKGMLYKMINTLNSLEANENDLKAFKDYIETEMAKDDSPLKNSVNGVQYTYDMDFLVYTKNVDGNIILSDTEALMQELLLEYFGMDLSGIMNFDGGLGSMSSMSAMSPMSSAVLWQELLPGDDGKPINDLILNQYELVKGSWPNEYNEILLIVDENNELDDMTLYALGLNSKEEMDALANAAFNKTELEIELKSWTYEEILDMEFKVILGSDCYKKGPNGNYIDMREDPMALQALYSNGISLKVAGIIRPKADTVTTMLKGKIAYTNGLTEYIIEHAKNSDAANAQLADPTTDIFTGLPFQENTGNLTNDQKIAEFKSYIEGLDIKEKANAYVKIMSIPSKEFVDLQVSQTLETFPTVESRREMLISTLIQQMGMSEDDVRGYLESMKDEDINEMFTDMIAEGVKIEYANATKKNLSGTPVDQLSFALDMAITQFTDEQFALYYDEVLEFSESSYKENLRKLCVVDLDSPSTINIYASSFENKDIIEKVIKDYNKDRDELSKITYTDYVGIMMSSITIIINAITYVLVAFVAISLVVSSIMIGVITLISVQERTKEIGILRAIGASKKNVSSMFNAETVIIGFSSGALGVLITYLLCIPINLILHALTDINNLNAYLPPQVALLLIGISILLTLFAGIIPSRSAAKKDPVVALRSE